MTRIASTWSSHEMDTPNAGPLKSPARVIPAGVKGPSNGGPGDLPWREQWLEDPESELAGRPDLVDRYEGTLRVIDYKTGVRQDDATPSQIQQLLFYAALIAAVLGELPGAAGVQDASGKLHPIAVTPEAVEVVRQEAVDALTALRRASEGVDRLLARPAEENCSTCPFRIVCPGFLASYTPEWRCGHVRVARVADVSRLDLQRVVDVEVLEPVWGPRYMRLVAFPFPEDVGPGQTWAFSDFEGPDSTAMARWNTLVSKVPV